MEKQKKKEIIKAIIAVAFLIILLIIVGLIMIKYSVEGEKNMPFYLPLLIFSILFAIIYIMDFYSVFAGRT